MRLRGLRRLASPSSNDVDMRFISIVVLPETVVVLPGDVTGTGTSAAIAEPDARNESRGRRCSRVERALTDPAERLRLQVREERFRLVGRSGAAASRIGPD